MTTNQKLTNTLGEATILIDTLIWSYEGSPCSLCPWEAKCSGKLCYLDDFLRKAKELVAETL